MTQAAHCGPEMIKKKRFFMKNYPMYLCLAGCLLSHSVFCASTALPDRVEASGSKFRPVEFPVKDKLNAAEGTISFTYTPSFSRPGKDLVIYRLFKCGKAAGGINCVRGGQTTIPWFLINTPESGPNYGIYQAFPLAAGRSYRFIFSWDREQMVLAVDGRIVAKKVKRWQMPFDDKLFFGGTPTENADGILSDLKISDKAAFGSPVKAFPELAGSPVTLTGIRDTQKSCSVIVESPSSPVTLRLRPGMMLVKAGEKYWAESSVSDPQIVTGENDGTLTLRYPPCYHNQVTVSPTGDNLLADGGFEQRNALPPGWKAIDNSKPLPTLNQGHEGFSIADSLKPSARKEKNRASVGNGARTGKNSLHLTKHAAGGALVVTSPDVKLRAGTSYLLTGYYHTTDLKFGSGAAMIVRLSGDGVPTRYIDGVVMARQTQADEWRMAFCGFQVPETMKNPRCAVILSATGNPFQVKWDDLDLRERPVMLPVPDRTAKSGQTEPVLSRDELREKLSRMRPYTAERRIEDGIPQLFLNGRKAPKFGYTGFLRAGHKDFAQSGVKLQWLYTITGNGGKNNWRGTPIWLADGKYNFAPLDQRLETLLRLTPDAVVMLYLGLTPYPAFFKVHPEAAALDEAGRIMPTQNSCWVTYASEAFRREGENFLRALAEHLKTSPYGKAVAGIHIVGGRDGQWFPHSYDGSMENQRAFRQWLRRHYKNSLEDLRKAWGDQTLTFEQAVLPKPSERNGIYFLDPANPVHRRLTDAERFRNVAPVETVEGFARVFKLSMGRPVYVSMYYNDISAGHDLGKNALREVLDSPWIDGIVGVVDYGWNRLPGFPGASVNLLSSPGLHGKILLGELDYRTEYSALWLPRAATGWGPVIVGNTRGAGENLAQQRRDMGIFLTHGQGAWMYALAGNGWAHPDMMKAIREALRAAQISVEEPRMEDSGDVACFVDERLMDYLGGGKSPGAPYRILIHQVGVAGIRNAFSRSGLKTDGFLLSDLTNPARKAYRINVFIASPSITPDEIDWIEKNLQKDGNILIFLFDAGRAAPGGFTQNVRRLTGISVRLDEKQIVTYRYEPRNYSDPLGAGLRYLGTETRGPAFLVEDADAVPIGIYQNTNLVGAAVKRHPDWTGIYIGAPGGVTPDFLRAAAGEAGIKPVGPSGDATYAGNGFIAIHALSSGLKKLCWQGNYDAVDMENGRILSKGNELTIPMYVGESRLIRLKKR